MSSKWYVFNAPGTHRILVTQQLPGKRWLEVLTDANYRVEVNTSKHITTKKELISKIGDECSGVIGQLTEEWDGELLEKVKRAGGKIYCNYAVGYDNVDIEAATKHNLPVGNTPGVLTETTAEMAVALTLACTRRIVESDHFMRSGQYDGWLPGLLLGERLKGQTVGVIGAGRIGSAYAVMMAQGFKMNILYYSRSKNKKLEDDIDRYNDYYKKTSGDVLKINQTSTLEELLEVSDVVSLHIPLNEETHHLIKAEQLSLMKNNAILINTSRGAVIDEAALARHCKKNEAFKAGLDVFENEPLMHEELKQLSNVTVTPHTGSATRWTRKGMAILAALNIKGAIENYPLWDKNDITSFLGEDPPKAIPSVVNAEFLEIS